MTRRGVSATPATESTVGGRYAAPNTLRHATNNVVAARFIRDRERRRIGFGPVSSAMPLVDDAHGHSLTFMLRATGRRPLRLGAAIYLTVRDAFLHQAPPEAAHVPRAELAEPEPC